MAFDLWGPDEVRRQYWGTWWPSRLWCQWVRPRLMPGRQAEIEAAWEYAEFLWRQDVFNAVLEAGKKVRE